MQRNATRLGSRIRRTLFAPAIVFSATTPAFAQSRYASVVVDFQQGTGGGIFVQDNILDGPQGGGLGAGSLDVLSLGAGGQVTVGFEVTIVDAPGADFTVYENGFVAGGSGDVFAEVARVEVSTDGLVFARFPAHYVDPGALTNWGAYVGLVGGTPCLANVLTNAIDPFDPVVSGGDAFDLAELAGDPAVLSGQVDLHAIHFVRLLDVAPGELDDDGHVIQDAGAADIDAVAVIHHAGNVFPDAPRVDLWRDALGYVHLEVSDPDGVADLDLARFRVSANLAGVPFPRLRNFFVLEHASPDGWQLVSPNPVGALALDLVLAVTIEDDAGLVASDQISLRY